MKLILVVLLLSIFNLNSQNESKKLKAGIYKWTSNVKANYPNHEINFEIKKGKNKSLGLFRGKSKIEHYYLEFETDKEKENYDGLTGEIFGVSDGENFYLPLNYCKDCNFSEKMYFRAGFVGEKYIYFDCFLPKNYKIINPDGSIGSLDGYEDTVVITLRRNKRYSLSKKFIKDELKQFPELYNQYKKEKKINSILKKYLKLLDGKK